MKKIEIKVCMGTTCFVMGASYLQELIELLPQKYGDKVEVSASPCLGLCSVNCEYSQAPYVKIDDEVVANATVEKVLEKINRKLENE